MLLIETIVMETAYLLDKLHLKKVRKYFKTFCKFMSSTDRVECFLEHMPKIQNFKGDNDRIFKRELYRVFSFYIPLLRMFEFGDLKNKVYKENPIYKKLYDYITSTETAEAIVNLAEANETLSSQCAIPLDKHELKQIIRDVIETEEKPEQFKKLENRVMEEIISNTNFDEIRIEDDEFDRDDNVSVVSAKNNRSIRVDSSQAPDCELRQQRTVFKNLNAFVPQAKHNSYSLGHSHDSESKEMEEQQSSHHKSSQEDHEDEESKGASRRVVDEDFLDLQMTVDQDVSTWNKVFESDEVVVFKKKTEGTPMVLIKAVATLRGIPKEIVFEAIYDTDIRQQWDKLFHHFEVVEHDEEKMDTVLYYVIKAPIGISNRDFLQRRKVIHDFPKKGVTYMHFKSIEHEDKPPVKGIVRAETIISGYVIEQIEDNPPTTRLTVISQNDIKGLIPKYLVNMASGKAPKQWIGNLITGCDELMKQR